VRSNFAYLWKFISIGVISFCEVTKLGELSATQFCLFMEIFEHWCTRLLRSDKFGRIGFAAILLNYRNQYAFEWMPIILNLISIILEKNFE
jgi:hypothetical protein